MNNFCKNCGTKLEGNEQHCPECGTPLNGVPEETLKYYENEEKRAKTSKWFKNSALFLIGAIIFLFVLAWAMSMSYR
ncbi:zinc-ribbon domain-containing protein [Methanobacterium formicicum]|jgi:uncharacterized membrane protein YvbJ|uniref:Zinc-ribbon domain-containing protein n=1 Tax=Methanobacterium formicicum TaxID=2162 RepID=A0A843AKU1_METFO|nr:zinc-ribbon domain-containing protein [Methanobacterium formicicum]MBF4474528.1 zinc-ribbon domain-containing protein [Methanobacterium formicicum]